MSTEKRVKKDVIAASIRPTGLLTAVLVNDGTEIKEYLVSKMKIEGKHQVFNHKREIIGFVSFEELTSLNAGNAEGDN